MHRCVYLHESIIAVVQVRLFPLVQVSGLLKMKLEVTLRGRVYMAPYFQNSLRVCLFV